jgi:hypothetical protein
MPRLLNVQRKRAIMKTRHTSCLACIYMQQHDKTLFIGPFIYIGSISDRPRSEQTHTIIALWDSRMVTSHLRHCLQTATSARRRLFGDTVCQQNTRNRVQTTSIGAKGPKICVMFTVKSSRFQRFFMPVMLSGNRCQGIIYSLLMLKLHIRAIFS